MTLDSNPTHILVVEDDVSLASWIADYLTDNGYLVTVADRGDEALHMIEDDDPDLVILDVNLPVQDGFDVCRQAREHFRKPILMLTARGEEADEVKGLEAGANDYLIKPVRPRALLARINTLLHIDPGNTASLNFGTLIIDEESRSVLLNDNSISLSTNEFDLLWLLASNAGQVMSREAMVEKLRGIAYDGFNRSVDILISRLRKKLSDNTSKPYKIKTVWGKGYLFTADSW